MSSELPIGPALPDWVAAEIPAREELRGLASVLEPLDIDKHARALFDANGSDPDDWTYLSYGPFADLDAYVAWLKKHCTTADPLFFAARDSASGDVTGLLSLMCIKPELGCIEIGHVRYSRALQRTRAATEIIYLLIKRSFELGYRRVEWKCDHLNAASHRAALRYGFTFEGIFRNAYIYKGRSRDTAWFSITDGEWPAVQARLETWLADSNFDANGVQKRALQDC